MGRINVTGRFFLCILATLVTAGSWLTRPPERLGLRVIDEGGRFNIMRIWWNPVDGESGRLEIIDGAEQHSLRLTPDLLLSSGPIRLGRNTSNVYVRMEVLRRNKPPLWDAVDFVGPIPLRPGGVIAAPVPPKVTPRP